ncbi:MAG: hypothetical protein V9F04_16990 [Dermatophilaceae bacterium]
MFDLLNLAAFATDGNAGMALTTVNLLGGSGDDVFNLAPYPTLAINVDGGDHVEWGRDQLPCRRAVRGAGGKAVLAAEGQQPVAYSNVEQVNLFEQLRRVFLSFIQR